MLFNPPFLLKRWVFFVLCRKTLTELLLSGKIILNTTSSVFKKPV